MMEKFKELYAKLKDKKRLEIVVAIILVVVILIIYFSSLDFGAKSGSNESQGQSSAALSTDYCAALEQKLNDTLSSISGAGRVRTVIHFETSTELVIAYIENISEGQSNKSPQVINVNGAQMPIVLKEIYPKVKGVLISAEGANEPRVKIELVNAAATLLAISPNLIYVTVMNK